MSDLDKEVITFLNKCSLPFNDFTTMSAGNSGDIWFGTTKGAIHYDGNVWEYRQGKRWLPDDYIRSISIQFLIGSLRF